MTEFKPSTFSYESGLAMRPLPVAVSDPSESGMPGSMVLAAPVVGIAIFAVVLFAALHHQGDAPGQAQSQLQPNAASQQAAPATTGAAPPK